MPVHSLLHVCQNANDPAAYNATARYALGLGTCLQVVLFAKCHDLKKMLTQYVLASCGFVLARSGGAGVVLQSA